jgi:hypothetical protein
MTSLRRSPEPSDRGWAAGTPAMSAPPRTLAALTNDTGNHRLPHRLGWDSAVFTTGPGTHGHQLRPHGGSCTRRRFDTDFAGISYRPCH